MRMLFGVLSLLVVLAVVAVSAKKSLHAMVTVPATDAAASATVATPKAVEQRVKDDIDRAMRQGADRNADAAP